MTTTPTVLVVGDGPLAAEWERLLSGRTAVERVDGEELERALSRVPDALVAIDRGPRGAAEALARCLHAMKGAALARALVIAPHHGALGASARDPSADRIAVAYHWTGLLGPERLRELSSRGGVRRCTLGWRDLVSPKGPGSAAGWQGALALARHLFGDVRLSAASGSSVRLETASGCRVEIVMRQGPAGMQVSVEGPAAAEWRWEASRETLTLAGTSKEREATPFARRALSLLLDPEQAREHSLASIESALGAMEEVVERWPAVAWAGARQLAESAALPRSAPECLGLRAESLETEATVTSAAPAPALRLREPPAPFEYYAFVAGLKPAVFLTVRPELADETAGLFEGAHVERRERRVRIEDQDRWIDRRDEGEARVELYVSRDPELARRAAALSADADPSENLRALGELLGYPACCVRAFAEQPDRSNNSLNRIACAARTDRDARWEPLLDDTFLKINAFFACSYRCSEATAHARATLDAVAVEHREIAAAIEATLGKPVLYFDHDHQLALEGDFEGDLLRYTGARVATPGAPAPGFDSFAAQVAAADALRWSDRALELQRAGQLVGRWTRIDPGLGILLPFGASPRLDS